MVTLESPEGNSRSAGFPQNLSHAWERKISRKTCRLEGMYMTKYFHFKKFDSKKYFPSIERMLLLNIFKDNKSRDYCRNKGRLSQLQSRCLALLRRRGWKLLSPSGSTPKTSGLLSKWRHASRINMLLRIKNYIQISVSLWSHVCWVTGYVQRHSFYLFIYILFNIFCLFSFSELGSEKVDLP